MCFLWSRFKIISSVSRGHIRFICHFIRHISFQLEISADNKKQRQVHDLPLFAILRGAALSRQTGIRKFMT